jgi:hypothetical protein
LNSQRLKDEEIGRDEESADWRPSLLSLRIIPRGKWGGRDWRMDEVSEDDELMWNIN